MEGNMSFQKVMEEEDWLIRSAIKQLHIYKDQDEYYQEGLIGLWEAYERFDPNRGASFRTFAWRTIRGKLLTYLRKTKRNQDHEVKLSEAMIEITVDEKAETPLERELISAYCEGLSESQANWVYKAFIEDKGPMQIAAEEKVGLETVKSWRRYALMNIRKNLNAELV